MTFKEIEHWNNHLSTFSEKKAACTKKAACRKVTIQVEPGKPGAEVSKNKNYMSKKEFAYGMCTG